MPVFKTYELRPTTYDPRPHQMTTLTQAFADLDTARHKAELYRQWHVGQRAGLPHQQVLRTMDEFARSPTVRDLRRALLAGLAGRASITAVTRAHPALFAPFEAALLELATLPPSQARTSLEKLAELLMERAA